MNSTSINAEQPEICFNLNTKNPTPNMEKPNHNQDTTFDKELYTIEWSDIENAKIDYENYLSNIEDFFREDFENDILKEEID